MGHKGPVLRPRCIGPVGARTQIPFIHSFPLSHKSSVRGSKCPGFLQVIKIRHSNVYKNFDYLTMREDTGMSRTGANRKENDRKRNMCILVII
jgi:hypothetical protein